MVIRDISIGDYSAENDANLSEYFVNDTHSYSTAEDISDHRYILLGRTGAGKSATLSYLNKKFKQDSTCICTFIRPGKSYLDAVVQMEEFHELKQAKGLEPILYKLIWQYVIMIAVLREKYGSSGPKKKGRLLSGEKLRAYKFLRKAEQLASEDKTLLDVISELLKEISVSLKGVTVKGGVKSSSSYEIMRDLIRETEDFHDKGFWDAVGGKTLYILFDDLDLGWDPNDSGQQALLRGLFEIMKNYAYRDRVKPLIALRTNILEGLNLSQREKYDNNILTIRWTKPNLEKMLLLRLKKYGGIEESGSFDQMFKINEDKDESPVDYMIKRTLYRPRDLIAFCRASISEASTSGSDRIEMAHVLAAETVYATDRLQALADEWRFLYPKLNALVTLMIKISTRDFDLYSIKPSELRNILVETKERILTAQESESYLSPLVWIRSYFPQDDEPYELVQILYRLGVIGFKSGSGRGTLNFVHSSEKMPGSINSDTRFLFHPMLHNISTGAIAFQEDSPWI